MAELTLFGFRSGHSVLHRCDVRCKILSLLFISMASLNVRVLALIILSGLIIILAIDCRLKFKPFLREIRYFLILMLIIVLARALSTKGTMAWKLYFLSISTQGLYEGVLICWRLFLVVLAGLLFVSTTRPSEIKAAVEWFFSPLPFVAGKRLATMLSLVLRFMPVILNQAKETAEAQRARCVEIRKNPLYRIKKMGFPLLRRMFENADRLVFAMEARCYNENRTDPDLCFRPADGVAILLISGLCGMLLII
jgi:energy-coupling factor transporter transmembrane protein EcfT